MENLKKKLKTIQEPNQSPFGADTDERSIDNLQSSSLSDDRRRTNAVNEHPHYHRESLDIEKLKNLSASELQLNNSNEDLNEYCLLQIFSYLSIDDMMQVAKVCSRWREVSQQWFEKVQTLKIEFDESCILKLFQNYHGHIIYEKTNSSDCKDFLSILHLYGHHIKYCQMDPLYSRKNEIGAKFIFEWVPILCKNIVDLEIHGRDYYRLPWNFEAMAKHWKKLENIKIRSLSQPISKDVYNLLRNNQQLKTLTLWFKNYGKNIFNNDELFTCLPTTIRKIELVRLSISEGTEWTNFISACKNFTSLESIRFLHLIYLPGAVITAITSITSLTHLSLSCVRNHESRRPYDPIANMKGLKSLDFSRNYDIDEDSFINILESCIQLEHLGTYSGIQLTDKGMDAIAKLEKLKCLAIRANRVITKSLINLCGSLEVLKCRNLYINCDDAIELLMKATELRFLNLDYLFRDSLLMKDILQAANKIANERANHILCITGKVDDPHFEAIDTPYFKYFKSYKDIPLKIIPRDIRYFINTVVPL